MPTSVNPRSSRATPRVEAGAGGAFGSVMSAWVGCAAADVGDPSAAARLGSEAGPAVEEASAAVRDLPAVGAGGRAGARSAGGHGAFAVDARCARRARAAEEAAAAVG